MLAIILDCKPGKKSLPPLIKVRSISVAGIILWTIQLSCAIQIISLIKAIGITIGRSGGGRIIRRLSPLSIKNFLQSNVPISEFKVSSCKRVPINSKRSGISGPFIVIVVSKENTV